MNFAKFLKYVVLGATFCLTASARMMDYDLGGGDVFDDGGFGVPDGSRGPGNALIATFYNAKLMGGTPTDLRFQVYYFDAQGGTSLPDGTPCCNFQGSHALTVATLTNATNAPSVDLYITTQPCSVSSFGGDNPGDNVSFTCEITQGITTLRGTTNFLFSTGGANIKIVSSASSYQVNLASTNITSSVPEPSTIGFGILGGGILLVRRRLRARPAR